jgi:hypothetical protein
VWDVRVEERRRKQERAALEKQIKHIATTYHAAYTNPDKVVSTYSQLKFVIGVFRHHTKAVQNDRIFAPISV